MAWIPLLVILVAGVSPAGTAPGLPELGVQGKPIIYRIDAYLDRAPDDVHVEERASLGSGEKQRQLLIVSYRRSGDSGDPWVLIRNLGAYHPDFLLAGKKSAIAEILDAPPGSHLRGSFQYFPGIHTLFVDPSQLRVE